jgi:hypothetical protein
VFDNALDGISVIRLKLFPKRGKLVNVDEVGNAVYEQPLQNSRGVCDPRFEYLFLVVIKPSGSVEKARACSLLFLNKYLRLEEKVNSSDCITSNFCSLEWGEGALKEIR